MCSRRGGGPSPARAAPPGAGSARPAPAGQYLYSAILVACSDWPTGVTTRPLCLEVEERVAGRELPAAWSALLYLCGMWGSLQLLSCVLVDVLP